MRLRDFDVRRRFTEVAMAWPIAVPSPFSPTCARSRIAPAMSRSYVIGTRVAARTPNVTMPMRSSCRLLMKSPISSLATREPVARSEILGGHAPRGIEGDDDVDAEAVVRGHPRHALRPRQRHDHRQRRDRFEQERDAGQLRAQRRFRR